jgi:esterase/lipase
MSKRVCQRKHFKRRINERFGIEINRKDQEEIVEKIKKKEAEIIYKQSNRVVHYLMEYKGNKMVMVYDKNRKSLITVLNYDEGYIQRGFEKKEGVSID